MIYPNSRVKILDIGKIKGIKVLPKGEKKTYEQPILLNRYEVSNNCNMPSKTEKIKNYYKKHHRLKIRPLIDKDPTKRKLKTLQVCTD